MNMKSRWNSISQETSPAAETSDPPASAFLERRPLKQEGSLAHPVNGYQLVTLFVLLVAGSMHVHAKDEGHAIAPDELTANDEGLSDALRGRLFGV